jgi:DNA-binding MarR family transcriptional regulator
MSVAPLYDPVIHATGRLQVCAVLAGVDEAEFAMVRDTVGVSDSVLSKHLKALEDAGYLKVRKAPLDGRSRTWVALTEAGRRAFAGHVAELTRLASLTAP